MSSSSVNGPLPPALLVLRVSLGAFMLVWALEKILFPEVTLRVFERFYFASAYGFEMTETMVIALGVPQTLLCIAIILGAFRALTYGLGFVLHALSTLSTWEMLISPFGAPNHLFVAAVPVLAAFGLLYVMRKEDRLLSVDAARGY